MKVSHTQRYLVGGFLFGLLFPLFSWFLDGMIFHDLTLGWDMIVRIHKGTPLHFVIDTVPFVLALAFGLTGINLDRNTKNKVLHENNLEEYNKENQKLVKHIRMAILIVPFLIGILMTISFFVLQNFISRQHDDATVINISGRQRMLSQRIAKDAVYLTNSNGKDKNSHINSLKKSISLFKESHDNLTKKSNTLNFSKKYKLSDNIKKLYLSLEPYYQGIIKSAENLSISNNLPDSSERAKKIQIDFENIERNEKLFLPIMNDIVFAYDNENQSKTIRLRIIQGGVALAVVVIIIILVIVGLRPLVNRVQQAFIDTEKANLELAFQNEGLQASEEEIRQNAEELQSINDNLKISQNTLKNYINRVGEAKKMAQLAAYDFDVVTGKITHTEHLNSILGLDKNLEITDKIIAEHIYHEDKKRVFEKRQEAITQRKDTFYRFRFKSEKFEKWHWFQGATHAVLDENNKLDYVVNVLQDITRTVKNEEKIERLLNDSQNKQQELASSEEELRQNAEELQSINDNLFVTQRENEEKQQLLNRAEKMAEMGSFYLDIESNDYSYSENLKMIYGLSDVEMTNPFRHIKYFHPEDKKEIEKQVMEIVQGKRDKMTITARFKGINHTNWKYLKLDGYLLRNINNKPLRILGVIQDVTQTELNKQLVAKSQKQLQSLSNNLQGIMFRSQINNDWKMEFISNGVEKLTGYKSEEFLITGNRAFADSIYEPVAVIDNQINEAIKNKTSYQIEYRLIHKDNSITWVEETATPIFDTEGNVLYIDGVIMDISARIKAKEFIEEQNKKLLESQTILQEQQQLLKDSEKIAKLGSYVLNLQTNEIQSSDNLPTIYGFDRNKPITREIFAEITHKEDLIKNRIALEAVLEKKEQELFVYYRARHNDEDEWKHYQSLSFIEYDENNNPMTLVGTVQDVTKEILESQKMESLINEISKNKNYLEEAQRLAKIVSYEIDIYSKEVKWSESFAQIFNILPENIPTTIDEFHTWVEESSLEEAQEGWAEAIVQKNQFDETYPIKTPTQDTFYIREKGYPIFDEKGRLISIRGTLQDITKVELAKLEIERKSKEIKRQNEKFIGSVNYAQRIQSAMLGGTQDLRNIFKDGFIFFEPKDVVSGDFYWYAEQENKKIAIVGDCTGHGVPGAFMSLLGTTILNEIILQQKITTPSHILDDLQKQIKQTLNQNNTGNKDGMDMAVVVLDNTIGTLEFAGAKNPLVYLKSGSETSLTVIKGDNLSIGGRTLKAENAKYTNHVIDTEDIEAFYLYSDGYQDQFGGEKGGKFMSTKFRKLLYDTHSTSMRHQRVSLKRSLMNWMGTENEQLDDICVMGITV